MNQSTSQPVNQSTLPRGSVRLHRNGGANQPYPVVKVADGPRARRRLARLVYERLVGPIPAGHIIWPRNGNAADCRPENLEAITRAECLRRVQARMSPARRIELSAKRAVIGRRYIRLAMEAAREAALRRRIERARKAAASPADV